MHFSRSKLERGRERLAITKLVDMGALDLAVRVRLLSFETGNGKANSLRLKFISGAFAI